MFAATHMAAGALIEYRLRERTPTALIALASAAALDMTIFWDVQAAEYKWPHGSFLLFRLVPYPHDVWSWLLVALLVLSTVVVAVLLRRYWWGMLWALMPDVIDWLMLGPLTGEHPIHDLIGRVSTPWGFALEMAFVLAVVVVLGLKNRSTLKRAP